MTNKEERISLSPLQLCFVVDDVKKTVDLCEKQLGWGPFNCFTADVELAKYRDWQGRKVTHVALGMAGAVQIEFLHMDEGLDAVALYQQQYERGLQHIGIHCQDRDAAMKFLEGFGAITNEANEYPGIRFGFMDTPTGEAMFELLQPTDSFDSSVVSGSNDSSAKPKMTMDPVEVNRVTVATENIDAAAKFYAAAFHWSSVDIQDQTLEFNGREFPVRRLRKRAGLLEVEIIQPGLDRDCPYRQHLQRGEHGLVHAGAECGDHERVAACLDSSGSTNLPGRWVESNEFFNLLSWECGKNSLQLYSQ